MLLPELPLECEVACKLFLATVGMFPALDGGAEFGAEPVGDCPTPLYSW